MIGNVSPSSRSLASSPPQAPVASQNTWTSAGSAKLLSDLTPQDWAVGDAMAAHTLDHGTPQEEPALPISVWNIALDRQNGNLPAGQPVTVDYLKNMEKGETNQGLVDAINRGIAYLETNMGTSSKNATSQNTLDISA